MNNSKELQPIKQRYGIVGNSDGLNRALDIAIQVAPTDLSVLIEGENGVGKEAIPRIIHDNSTRKHQKYFAINCGSIPEGTIDSELFGHEKGAFTGAIGEHEGYFGAANKGTLFLDEVGELPLSTQVRLLRVLETGEYLRVGSNEVRKTDVRIIAATNVKMQKAIREGRFREDLYYRLATIPISIPPLRERGSDIYLLFRKFAADVAEKYRLDPISLTDEARRLLNAYKWPGNIRQLKNVVEQLSIISREREITVDMLQAAGITDDSLSAGGLVLARDTSHSPSEESYANERNLLWQQLFTLSKEIKELKELIHANTTQMASIDPHHPAEYVSYNPIGSDGNIMIQRPATITTMADRTRRADDIETAEAYVEEAPRSMKELTAQTIVEALKRNNYNRKRTARELGISERTIYRRIKEMGLEL
ncbi:MAG: sigma-54-dependent Fis family transcriptional regulator [Prevotellaceae bacterium]|nr:sigma-54-dependent Fis family transcriptional regulator [Prevotellaceae bacterium]